MRFTCPCCSAASASRRHNLKAFISFYTMKSISIFSLFLPEPDRCCCTCTTCRTCCCTRCCTCCRPCCGCGCGCCGCGGGGGGRKRRSLDNLRIQLGAKKAAELKGEEHPIAEYPRQKRDIMCHNECISPAGGHFGHEHDIYGDY
ncbi:hypothetical protein TELCIR_17294 [Teladorsagia circumcincta]|uniref:Uncharacterized protein n=1 Tax=Teladorsagia circumcincta TaxID=45464 RepID=A0A2G9TT57_TELCI|nr:hypothetical protein TELCIR_17294 [Teladorsagia circumcincta]